MFKARVFLACVVLKHSSKHFQITNAINFTLAVLPLVIIILPLIHMNKARSWIQIMLLFALIFQRILLVVYI